MRNFLIISTLTALATWINWGHIKPLLKKHLHFSQEKTQPATPDPETYAVLIEEIHAHKTKLAQQYFLASTDDERNAVLQSAADLLELTMPALMRCWLGTEWDFNGTETTPGAGKIACGYYVSTIMRDCGFQIERIKLAQQASQTILLTFLPREDLSIQVGKDYKSYMQSFRERDHGIYIIGLDKHVGFIVYNEEGIRFLHSGGIHKKVVDEDEDKAWSIKNSDYRVIGNLTKNRELLRRWLQAEPLLIPS